MRRNTKKRISVIAMLLIFIMLISVGYSAIETVLNINGTVTLKTRFVNIYFSNVQVTTGSVANATPPSIPANSKSVSTISWTADIKNPGEFFEFTVDVTNNGNADAMIETAVSNILSSSLTENQAKYLDYSILYENDGVIEQKDKLEVGETKKIKVRLACKSGVNAEDLPEEGESEITLSYGPNYIIADNSAVEKILKFTYYFKKPSDWGNNIKAYIWRNSPFYAPTTWANAPAMTFDSTKNAYKITFMNNSSFAHDHIIFNDGTNQTEDLTINPYDVNNMVYDAGPYSVTGKQRLSFKNNSNWTDVYACFFNSSSEIASTFPGTKITSNVLSNNVYYSIINSGQYKFVMFNDGTNQSDAVFIPGGSDLVYDTGASGYNWMPVNIPDESSENEQRVYVSATFSNFATYIANSAYDVNAYAWKGSGGSEVKNARWPGIAMTRLDSSQKVYYIDLDKAPGFYEHIIFNTNNGNGNIQTLDLDLPSESNYIYIKGWIANTFVNGSWKNFDD